MERDYIAVLGKLVKRNKFKIAEIRLRLRIVYGAKDVHTESVGDFCRFVSDLTEADYTDRLSRKLDKLSFLKAEILSGGPLSVMNSRIVNGNSVIDFKNERKGELSDCRSGIARNVAYRNSVFFCGSYIDNIVACC